MLIVLSISTRLHLQGLTANDAAPSLDLALLEHSRSRSNAILRTLLQPRRRRWRRPPTATAGAERRQRLGMVSKDIRQWYA